MQNQEKKVILEIIHKKVKERRRKQEKERRRRPEKVETRRRQDEERRRLLEKVTQIVAVETSGTLLEVLLMTVFHLLSSTLNLWPSLLLISTDKTIGNIFQAC